MTANRGILLFALSTADMSLYGVLSLDWIKWAGIMLLVGSPKANRS